MAKKALYSFLCSILGGAAIGIGGTAYLSIENTVVGALFFSIGLFVICTFGMNLFTGKVCYIFDNKPSYAAFCLSVWLGNLIGAALVGGAVRLTRISVISERASTIVATKLNDTLLSVFILAIFCNIMIYIAAEGFKKNPHVLGKYLGIILCIVVFILSGFEHSIANMYYLTVAGAWSGKALLYIVVISLGNSVGGVIFPLVNKLKEPERAAIEEKEPAAAAK